MISGNFLKNKKVSSRVSRFIQFFLQKNLSISLVYFLFLPISSSYFLFSPFCVQKMPKIDFSTSKSLENQLEWLQFSEIIVGRTNLPHHPITCLFIRTRKNKLLGDVLYMKEVPLAPQIAVCD